MKLLWTFLMLFLSLNYGVSQYCTSVGPTSLIDSNVETLVLIGDASSINYMGCPSLLGLDDQTSLSTTITAGNTYTIDIQFGTCGGNYSGIGEVWIDFNQNNNFELSESIGSWTGTPPTAISTFNFTPPVNSINGICRMRVIQREGGSLPIDPCGTFQWGSATDFSINIAGGIDCSGFIGNTEEEAININAIPYSNTIDNSFCYFNNNEAYPSPDVYFLLNTITSVHSVTVSLCGSSFDTFLAVFDKFGNTITFNDDSDNCGAQSEVTFNINNRDSILIIVQGWGNEQGEFDITISGEYLSIENFKNTEYQLYPNPAHEFINLNGISSQEIKIFNALGKLVQKTDYTAGQKISVKQLPPGFYFVNFHIDSKNQTNSLIIK